MRAICLYLNCNDFPNLEIVGTNRLNVMTIVATNTNLLYFKSPFVLLRIRFYV